MQADYPEVILASASGARASILAGAGVRFRQVPSLIDEAEEHKHFARGASAEELAASLARLKADKVLEAEPGAVVIGADQVLSLNGEVFQKPTSEAEARRQLLRLRGCSHELHAAVCVLTKGHVATFADKATLTMRPFSDEFLAWYLDMAGDAILTSVGAYHLEGLGIHLFSDVKGDYFTILGLPVLPVLAELRRLAILAG